MKLLSITDYSSIVKSVSYFHLRTQILFDAFLDNLPANWTHYERMQNERLPTMNKWMMAQIRLQHEIGRLNKAC